MSASSDAVPVAVAAVRPDRAAEVSGGSVQAGNQASGWAQSEADSFVMDLRDGDETSLTARCAANG